MRSGGGEQGGGTLDRQRRAPHLPHATRHRPARGGSTGPVTSQPQYPGEDRPGLTAGTGGGPWTSWVRLWSASPRRTPLPRTRAQPLAKAAQDKDCHAERQIGRPDASSHGSGREGHGLLPRGLAQGSDKAMGGQATKQGSRREEPSFTALSPLSSSSECLHVGCKPRPAGLTEERARERRGA